MPTTINMIPPNLVDQIYRLEGSVASLDFQLSNNNQKTEGLLIIKTPILSRNIPVINNITPPLIFPLTNTDDKTSFKVHFVK
jgi:hypothetical protein